MKDYENILKQVNELMKKLRTTLLSANLNQHTELRAKKQKETRWSSNFQILKRHKETRDNDPALKVDGIDDFLIQSNEHHVDNFLSILEQWYDMNGKLQRSDSTVRLVRAYINAILEEDDFYVNCSALMGRLFMTATFNSECLIFKNVKKIDWQFFKTL